MLPPQIITTPEVGIHNTKADEVIFRLEKNGHYRDLSTIMIVPAFGSIPTKVVSSWMNMITPPNQKFFRMFAMGMEVGEAFSQSINHILNNPSLSSFKYILTVEHDNVVQPDSLLKLLESMEANPQYSWISGLYYTKGFEGVPQIWGDPMGELNFRPQKPRPGEIIECCGTGMGFALWRIEMFKDPELRRPFFKTVADATGVGTQDLYFSSDARKRGYRCAVDCNVPIGHYDLTGIYGLPDTTW